ncbi:MAG: transcriptional regulator NrdR [archaeon]
MKCPFCHQSESKVIDKRETDGEMAFRRRRECLNCQKRFTTYERIEDISLIILKKDGKKESYSREKLKNGMVLACQKRDVTDEKIEQAVDFIEKKLREYKESEIPSSIVGKWVLSKLKTLDKVAYIRFASVHKRFKDIEEMKAEVKKLAQ